MKSSQLLFYSLLLFPCFAPAKPPQVLWFSTPVQPGEAVQVFGTGFGTSTVVRAAGLPAELLTAADDGFAFALPAKVPADRPIACEADGIRFTLNAPTVWWAQGDRGEAATPGGWVRVFGTSLERVTAQALGFGAWACVTQDCWSATFRVPADAAAGAKLPYSLSLAAAAPDWPTNVFDVTRFGAVPNDRHDDSDAIRAALAAMQKNGGGILYFPCGRYGMQGTLALPPHSLLKGEGEDCVLLQWPDEDNPDYPLVTLTHHAGIEDIFLASGNFCRGVVTFPARPDGDTPYTSESITLNRVRIRFLHTDVSTEEGIRRYGQRAANVGYWDAGAICLQAKNLRVTDCDFYTSKLWNVFHADYALIRGNRFTSVDCFYYQGQHLIVEDNDNRGGAASFSNCSRESYFGNNLFGENYGGIYGYLDRESFTFDHGRTYYSGFARCDGTRVRLPVSPQPLPNGLGQFNGFQSADWRTLPSRWIGLFICIGDGTGRGQFRTIQAIEGNDTVVIDRPWEIAPDSTSIFSVSWDRYHSLIVNNSVYDGNVLQAYGNGLDVIFAGNRCYRNSGILGQTGYIYGIAPNWFMQFIGNEILDGTAIRGPSSYTIPAEDSGIGIHAGRLFACRPNSPSAYFCSFRRNHLANNSRLFIKGKNARHILATGNVIRKNPVGIDFRDSGIEAAAVWGNRFEQVEHPYRLNGSVVADLADPAKMELADLLDLDIPDDAFTPLAAGGQTNLAVRFAVSAPASLPSGELTLDSAAPPTGWTARLVAPLKLAPGRTADGCLELTRPDTSSDVFRLPVVWRFRAGMFNKTAALVYGERQFRLCHWLLSPEIASTRETPLLSYTNWLGAAAEKLTPATATNRMTGLDLNLTRGNVVYGRSVVTVRRPLRVSVKYAYQADRPVLLCNGRYLSSSNGKQPEPEVTLQPGENVFEIIKRYQPWTSRDTTPCHLWVTLTVLDPIPPGEIKN